MTPLLVTDDPLLRDELLRLSAAAGVVPEQVADPAAALAGWRTATAVLIGADLVAPLAECSPPRRGQVFVLTRTGVSDLQFRAALGVGAEAVLELPAAEHRLVELLGDLLDPGSGPGRSVGVLGGSGGAGASVFGCALALTAARLGPVMLMDTDPWGPGQGRLVGLPSIPVGWESLARSPGRLGAQALRDALPRVSGAEVGVLTWAQRPGPIPERTAREALAAGLRGHRLVVVDLPRAGGAGGLSDWIPRLDLVVLVVRADLCGVAAAGRMLADLPPGRFGLVLRGSPGATIAVEELLGHPVLARVGEQRGLIESIELGLGPLRGRGGSLRRAAEDVLWHLDD